MNAIAKYPKNIKSVPQKRRTTYSTPRICFYLPNMRDYEQITIYEGLVCSSPEFDVLKLPAKKEYK